MMCGCDAVKNGHIGCSSSSSSSSSSSITSHSIIQNNDIVHGMGHLILEKSDVNKDEGFIVGHGGVKKSIALL
jgi:hypothetical protein